MRGFSGKVKVRFRKPWRGYRVGDVIQPPAALRDALIQATDPLGNPVAEVVKEEVKEAIKEEVKEAPAEPEIKAKPKKAKE